MTPAELLDPATTIAIEAGRRIMAIYDSADFGVAYKDDESPLTLADLAAHRYIVAELAALAPEIPVLSEEDADIAYPIRRDWNRYWLVDPLDGTKEFIKKNGDFTVNIALVENGVSVLGVVHAPALEVSYVASVGVGSLEIRNGVKTHIRTRPKASIPTLVVSRSHKDAKLEAFLAGVPEHEAVSKGSSLKFCQVAAGEADLYPRTGLTSEWDTAAGQCVVEQAGGVVLELPGLTPMRYNQKASLLNPLFAVIGDTGYDWTPLLKTIT